MGCRKRIYGGIFLRAFLPEKNTEMGRLEELDGRWLQNTAISLVRNKNLHEQTEFVASMLAS